MALGKTSKKTQKTTSEAPSKSKATKATAITRAAQTVAETSVKDAAAATTKSRKKSTAGVTPVAVPVEGTAAESVVVHSVDPVKTLTAAAGSGEHTKNLGHTTEVKSQTNGSHDATGEHVNGSHYVNAADHSYRDHVNSDHANGSHHATERQHVTREEIAHLAYRYWAERGYSHGSAEEDWKRAEAELIKR